MDLSGLGLSNPQELEARSVRLVVSHQLKRCLHVGGQSQQLSSRGLAPLNGNLLHENLDPPHLPSPAVSQAATLTS